MKILFLLLVAACPCVIAQGKIEEKLHERVIFVTALSDSEILRTNVPAHAYFVKFRAGFKEELKRLLKDKRLPGSDQWRVTITLTCGIGGVMPETLGISVMKNGKFLAVMPGALGDAILKENRPDQKSREAASAVLSLILGNEDSHIAVTRPSRGASFHCLNPARSIRHTGVPRPNSGGRGSNEGTLSPKT